MSEYVPPIRRSKLLQERHRLREKLTEAHRQLDLCHQRIRNPAERYRRQTDYQLEDQLMQTIHALNAELAHVESLCSFKPCRVAGCSGVYDADELLVRVQQLCDYHLRVAAGEPVSDDDMNPDRTLPHKPPQNHNEFPAAPIVGSVWGI